RGGRRRGPLRRPAGRCAGGREDELPDTPSEVPHSVTGACERDACHSRGRSPLYCSTCGDERVFEQPRCPDAAGGECPERACTGCGPAALAGSPPPALPRVATPAPTAAGEPATAPGRATAAPESTAAPARGRAAGRAATVRAAA